MYSIALYRGAFDFYLVYLGLLFLIPFSFSVKPNLHITVRAFGIITAILFIQFLITSYVGSEFSLVFKQVILITFTLLVLYLSFQALDFDLLSIFRAYYNLIFIVSLLILIQQIAHIIGIAFVYDLSWILNAYRVEPTEFGMLRTGGLSQEPAHFVYVSFPAIYFAISRILGDNKNEINYSLTKAIIMLCGFICTFSSIGIIGIFLYFIIKVARKSLPKLVIGLVAISILAMIAYSQLPFFQMRINDTFEYSGKIDNIENTDNWSTYALLSNAYVTMQSMEDHPLIGAGLGNHVYNHEKYLSNIVSKTGDQYSLNKEDANSLMLRLLSETGLIGFGLIIYLLFRFKIKKRTFNNEVVEIFFLINEGVFLLIILKLIRDGNYAVNGFLFFLLLYYFSYKQIKLSNTTCK